MERELIDQVADAFRAVPTWAWIVLALLLLAWLAQQTRAERPAPVRTPPAGLSLEYLRARGACGRLVAAVERGEGKGDNDFDEALAECRDIAQQDPERVIYGRRRG